MEKQSIPCTLSSNLIAAIAAWLSDAKSMINWTQVNRNYHQATSHSPAFDMLWKAAYLRDFEPESLDDRLFHNDPNQHNQNVDKKQFADQNNNKKTEESKQTYQRRYKKRYLLDKQRELKHVYTMEFPTDIDGLTMDTKRIYFWSNAGGRLGPERPLSTIELDTKTLTSYNVDKMHYSTMRADSFGSLVVFSDFPEPAVSFFDFTDDPASRPAHDFKPTRRWTCKQNITTIMRIFADHKTLLVTDEIWDDMYSRRLICVRDKGTGDLLRHVQHPSGHIGGGEDITILGMDVNWKRQLIYIVEQSVVQSLFKWTKSVALLWMDLNTLQTVRRHSLTENEPHLAYGYSRSSMSFNPAPESQIVYVRNANECFVGRSNCDDPRAKEFKFTFTRFPIDAGQAALVPFKGRVYTNCKVNFSIVKNPSSFCELELPPGFRHDSACSSYRHLVCFGLIRDTRRFMLCVFQLL